MSNRFISLCPICDMKLIPEGKVFSIEDLFRLWQPINFPDQIIDEHKIQSNFTQLHRCSNCKLEVFLPEIIGTSGFYAILAKQESSRYYEDTKWEFQEALTDIRKSDEVFEVGCGPGNFLEIIRPLVGKAYGMEYNEAALHLARSRNLTVFGTNENMSRFLGQFDKVFAFHVLEHVKNPIEFIKELSKYTKKGGSIGISVPNQDGPIKYINPCNQNMPPHHVTRWRLDTFRRLALKTDLKLIRYAFEPLDIKDSYYYSHYWVDYRFSSKTYIGKFLNRGLHWFFGNSFRFISKILKITNIKKIPILKGQSLYVLFEKN